MRSCGLPVRPDVPSGRNTTVVVIGGVNDDISDEGLIKKISALHKDIGVNRYVMYNCVKVVFSGDPLSLPVRIELFDTMYVLL